MPEGETVKVLECGCVKLYWNGEYQFTLKEACQKGHNSK